MWYLFIVRSYLHQLTRLQEHCCSQQTKKPLYRSTKQYHTIPHKHLSNRALHKSQETPPFILAFTVHFINISCEGLVQSRGPERREKKKFPVSLSLKINLSSLKRLGPPTQKSRQQAVGQNDTRHIIQNRWEGGTPRIPDVEISSGFPTAAANKSLIIKLAGYANMGYTSLTCMWEGLTEFTAACGGDAGAGAGDTGICHRRTRPPVEIIPALFTAGSFGVALAVHADAWKNRGGREGWVNRLTAVTDRTLVL